MPYLRRIRGALRHVSNNWRVRLQDGLRPRRDEAVNIASYIEPHYSRFERNYGDFHLGESFEHLAIRGLAKPSGSIRGAVVHFCTQVPRPRSVLLPGEPSAVRAAYALMLGVSDACIVTAGLMEDSDVQWDFENDPPQMGTFDLVLSQAMLEHLIDPYKHMRDLAHLLNPGGHVIVLTVLPGFHYHRHPIDCQRFYPDWFEETAKRLSLEVVDRLIGEFRIVYLLRRPLE